MLWETNYEKINSFFLINPFSLYGNDIKTDIDTQPDRTREITCNQDENGFRFSKSEGSKKDLIEEQEDREQRELSLDDVQQLTDEVSVINTDSSNSTRSSSDYNHLDGVNFSDLIQNFSRTFTGTLGYIYALDYMEDNLDNGTFIECDPIYFNGTGYVVTCLYPYNQLYNSAFLREDDYNEYALDFNMNRYVPQGITKDGYGNLYISWYYHKTEDYTKPSVIMKFDPTTNKIEAVYSLPNSDFENPPHVGGIGYTKYSTWTGSCFKTFHILFVSDGFWRDNQCYINIYQIVNGDLVLIDKKMIFDISENISSNLQGIRPDGIGISNNYLWVNEFHTADEKYLMGYQFSFNYINGSLSVTLGHQITHNNEIYSKSQYRFKLPKEKIQGSYTISDPDSEGRLKFYLTKSYDDYQSYSFKGVIDTKDLDNDGVIDGPEFGEWQWESFFSPNGIGLYRELPAGIEGITELDDKLWVPNEGAAEKYSGWSNNRDGARELLVINDKFILNPTLYPSGAIVFKGDGLNNFGTKIVLVIAQNKEGGYYYSIGELSYKYEYIEGAYRRSAKMYVFEPDTDNPEGYQDYYRDLNEPSIGRAKVYIEDVKALILWNLDETSGDSDDWSVDEIEISFDENSYDDSMNSGNPSPSLYQAFLNDNGGDMNLVLGDNPGDGKGIMVYFNTKHGGSDDLIYGYFDENTNGGTFAYSEAYTFLNECINDEPYTINCLEDFEIYIENNKEDLFCETYYYLNYPGLDRLTDITIPFCQ